MPLTGKQKAAIVIGGLLVAGTVTAIVVYKATAKVPISPVCTVDSNCPSGYVCKNGVCVVAPPSGCTVDSDCPAGYVCQNGVCVQQGTGIPYKVNTRSAPSAISQNLAFYGTGAAGNICLKCDAYYSATDNTVTVWGYTAYRAYFQVIDAAGHGVPNVTMQVWPLQSRDDAGGVLFINGLERTASSPVKVVTDANGIFSIWFEYHQTDSAVILLKNKTNINCCVNLAGSYTVVGSVGYPNGCCGNAYIPFPVPTVPCYGVQTATSDLKLFTVHAEQVNAPAVYTEISLSAKFQSKCFW